MPREPRIFCRAQRHVRARQRQVVLRLGRSLGWQPGEIMAFAEGLTNCPWRWCGCAELRAVALEFRRLRAVIEAKAARRAARDREHARHELTDDLDATQD